MKTFYKIILIFFAMTLSVSHANAQIDIDTVQVMNRCRQKVGMLNDYIKQMASKEKSEISKRDTKSSALSLFINDGKEYTEIIERNGIRKNLHRDGAQMEISNLKWVKVNNRSIQRENRYKKPVGSYFDGLINFKYKTVEIQTTDIKEMQVGGIYQIDDGRYVCIVYYDQKFYGKMADGGVYSETTRKYVDCTVEIVTNPYSGRNEYLVKLGDIHVVSTHSIYN